MPQPPYRAPQPSHSTTPPLDYQSTGAHLPHSCASTSVLHAGRPPTGGPHPSHTRRPPGCGQALLSVWKIPPSHVPAGCTVPGPAYHHTRASRHSLRHTPTWTSQSRPSSTAHVVLLVRGQSPCSVPALWAFDTEAASSPMHPDCRWHGAPDAPYRTLPAAGASACGGAR